MPDNTTDYIKSGVLALTDVLLNASTCFDIWSSFRDEANRPIYEPVTDEFPILFETITITCLVSITILLYSVQETRPETYNIPRLLKVARERYPNETRLDQLDDLVAKLKPTWIKVSKIRGAVFGHRKAGVDPSQIFEDANLYPSDFLSLIDGYKSFLITYAQLLALDAPNFNLSATSENHRAMQLLRSAIALNNH